MLFESVFGRYIKAINDRIDRRMAILEDHELTECNSGMT